MQKITILAMALSMTFIGCSSDGDSDSNNNNPSTPDFAMTAKLNGTVFEANNPFNNNEFSNTNIFSYYPIEDFVLLQGRQGGIWGNPEINLWLKRADIAVGTYTVSQETFDTPTSHFIDLIDNSNDISEHTKEGTIVITEVNASAKIVKGTFTFKTVQELDNPAAPVDINVTEGTFHYKYE